ncbi:MAG: CDP-diacylglycerol--glycerol-3-phosphate 3-phosphatidyltransferase [Bacteroidetes bacterium CG12_big_fil_rev_8_21_14_0_65_60_17]|nr:MAG: CDP-diacylglycerol--glycerol-3-phosphate 3-phosphatidyltransferase [Bacteroidetes bacterium CG12_big_fil_rev_8_21_14_0_65_60_17]
MKHVPNALTVVRILVTPVLLYLLYRGGATGHAWALVLFVAASLSDWLDGKLARLFSVRSRLGQFLDPMADKVLVLGTFGMLWWLYPSIVPLWAVLLIALRDIGVTLLRSVYERQGRSLTTSRFAKWKTAAQLTFLIGFLVLLTAQDIPGAVGHGAGVVLDSTILVYVLTGVVLVTLYTGYLYFRTA